MNLNIYKSLIESNPLHIATNEMINTQKNIQVNDNIALTSFNSEWKGVRLFGTANYFS